MDGRSQFLAPFLLLKKVEERGRWDIEIHPEEMERDIHCRQIDDCFCTGHSALVWDKHYDYAS